MNLLLLRPSELSGGSFHITDSRAEHIIKVLKPSIGDRLRAGALNGFVGSAEITDIDSEGVKGLFNAETEPPKSPDLSLIVALPRPKVFRRILSGVVSMGIKDIHIINCWRVEKSYWSSPYISEENIEKYCFDALMQSKDTVMPDVSFHRFFTGFMEDGLAGIPGERDRFIAHPYSDGTYKPAAPAVVAVGPEGGFIERELETFADAGFKGFSMGERTLTTEHFVPYVLGSILGR